MPNTLRQEEVGFAQEAESNSTSRSINSLQRMAGHRKKSNAAYRRVGVKMAQEERDGTSLIKSLNLVMAEKGHSVDEAASALGISGVYLRALANGTRQITDVDRRVLQRAAEYIGMPVAQVYLMAGVLTPDDFFCKNSLDVELSNALKSMQNHPMWAGYAPDVLTWDGMRMKEKLFMTMLYETTTGQRFLTSVGVPDVV